MFAGDETSQYADHLAELLKKSQDRILQLEIENKFYRDRHNTMRHALEQARSFIQASQKIRSFDQVGRWIKIASPMLRFSERVSIFFIWSARVHRKAYMSRSRLEKALLRQSRKTIAGIEGVVVDFVRGERIDGEINWRICGIASGTVDAAEAMKAVQDAARSFEACELVADGSPLDGRPVKARPLAPQESPTRPTQGRSIFR